MEIGQGLGAIECRDLRQEAGQEIERPIGLGDEDRQLGAPIAARLIGATFQTLPGASFVVNGATPARDAALTTAAAEVTWKSGLSVAATFEGEFSSVTRSYAGKGVVRYQW